MGTIPKKKKRGGIVELSVCKVLKFLLILSKLIKVTNFYDLFIYLILINSNIINSSWLNSNLTSKLCTFLFYIATIYFLKSCSHISIYIK